MASLKQYNFTEQPEPPPVESQIKDCMLQSEIHPPSNIMIDGNIHRFATGPHGSDDAGWYVFYSDGIPAGRFGDWRTGVENTFRANIGRVLSAAEEMAIIQRHHEAKQRRDQELLIKRQKAAETVQGIWENAGAASADHPYLKRKGIQPNGARITGDGRLIVPLFDEQHNLSSLQYISTEGEKRYHPGGATGGMFCILGEIKNKVYVVEGFATGATVYETMSCPVVISYSAGNLEPVCAKLRATDPALQIIIIADNDKTRVGQNHAEQAAAKHGATVIIPPMEGDANDYKLAGYDLAQLLTPKKMEWLTPIDDWCSQPKPLKWLVKGWIQEGSFLMLHGPSGCGKTFVALDLMLHMATEKTEWNGHKIKGGPVVYLAGEGNYGLRARVAAWMQENNEKPRNMWVSDGAINLNTPTGLQQVLSYIRSIGITPRMIVVDTLHRFLDGDENSPIDSKTMIDACAILQREFGAAVMLVHHTGVSEEAQKRGRGSSSWRGSCDTEISVRPDGDNLIMEALKIKDGEEPHPLYFELKTVDIEGWFDDDGDQVKSAIVSKTEKSTPEKSDKNDGKIRDAVQSFRQAWASSGSEIADGKPFLSHSAWKNHIVSEEGKSEGTAKQYVKTGASHGYARHLHDKKMIEKHAHGLKMLDEKIVSTMLLSRSETG